MIDQYIKTKPHKTLTLFCNSENKPALKSFKNMGFIPLPASHPQYQTIIDIPHGNKSVPLILEPTGEID